MGGWPPVVGMVRRQLPRDSHTEVEGRELDDHVASCSPGAW
jgi:hypothetical protein